MEDTELMVQGDESSWRLQDRMPEKRDLYEERTPEITGVYICQNFKNCTLKCAQLLHVNYSSIKPLFKKDKGIYEQFYANKFKQGK